ncbi:adenylate/guanylate cyclase domain-containing protein [Rhodoferax sp.]|uniref:CHASE2 domain-containing protein n=1 Tax=Rhodoferax sp. TaxID=50421 RepID=UPI0025EDE105|nr:adenylate/guanylate cyclase domain-containing protein [Rhodoferax sp.]
MRKLLTPLLRLLLPVGVLCALLIVQFEDPLFRMRVRDLAFDQLQKLHPAPYVDDIPVRVVAIDDPSLAAVGQWPWPRTVMAQIVDQLTAMGARVVVMDLILAESDRTSPEHVKQFWPDNPQLDALLAKFPSHDQILADSMARSRVVTGVLAQTHGAPGQLPARPAQIVSQGGDARDWLKDWAGGTGFLPPLSAAAAGAGVVTVVPDHDGILRSIPLVNLLGGRVYPGLGLDALRVYMGEAQLAVQVRPEAQAGLLQQAGISGIGLGPRAFLPTGPDSRVWLHARPQNTDRYVSAIDVLAGQVEPSRIKDHIVIIGATSAGLGDIVRTPLGEAVPGLEGHLQLMEQLLTSEYLLRPMWENTFVAVLWVFSALVLAWLLAKFRPAWSVVFVGAGMAGLLVLSNHLFQSEQLLLDPVFPAAGLLGLFLSLAVPSYLRTEYEQRWIKNAFSRYVSPNRVKYLQEHPETLALGGEYRECSFVMTDLAGFTAMMEKYEPAMLSALLNEYLDGMIAIAFAHEGTLDRIVGDAVAVMFSAPVAQPDHATRAVACALAMDQFANRFSQQQHAQGIPFGKTRIGVNTGDVLVGNFGGQVMLDYRALGDAINTAARLETLNNHLGTRISVSASTVEQCPDFVGRPAGRWVLKGKHIPTSVFEPLTVDECRSERVTAYLAAYALMEAELPDALAAFQDLHARYPDDALVGYHLRRLEAGENGSLIVMGRK